MRFLLIIFLFINLQVNANARLLTPNAEISIITCSPGNDIHSHFGHSAIRVLDSAKNIDYVFNYGTFDFNAPGFYWKFCKGKLNYFLSVTTFNRFKLSYIAENRSIFEQRLSITYMEKLKIYNALLENYKPSNRYYLYDFLYDNCATRVRDILQKNLSSTIHYNYTKTNKEQSFLDLLNSYLENSPWMRLGINIILGTPAQKVALPYEKMFLPDYIMYSFDNAKYDKKNITKPVTTTFNAKKNAYKYPWYFTPLFVFISLLIIIIILKLLKVYSTNIDIILILLAGIVGIIISFLWFFTDHSTTKWNYNILWALPSHFIISILLFFKKNYNWIKIYFKISLGLFVLFMILNFNNIEIGFYFFLIILILSIIRMSFSNYFVNK